MSTKSLPGSYEDTRSLVEGAVRQRFGAEAWVMDTFSDHVFYCVAQEGMPAEHYKIGYSISEAGDVVLDPGDPQAVERVEAIREKGMPVETSTLERKNVPFSVDSMSGDEVAGWEFSGYASVFNVKDQGGDTVRAGAFTDSLRERRPILMWRHDEPIGTLEASEDDYGLKIAGRILPTSQGKDAYILMKGGAVDRLSIGWLPREGGVKRVDGGRDLTAINLFEVSVVPIPMLEAARITEVKEAAPAPAEKTVDDRLFDAGRRLVAAVADARVRYLRRVGEGGAPSQAQLKSVTELGTIVGDSFVALTELEMKARGGQLGDVRLALLRGMVTALATMIDSVPGVESLLPPEDDGAGDGAAAVPEKAKRGGAVPEAGSRKADMTELEKLEAGIIQRMLAVRT